MTYQPPQLYDSLLYDEYLCNDAVSLPPTPQPSSLTSTPTRNNNFPSQVNMNFDSQFNRVPKPIKQESTSKTYDQNHMHFVLQEKEEPKSSVSQPIRQGTLNKTTSNYESSKNSVPPGYQPNFMLQPIQQELPYKAPPEYKNFNNFESPKKKHSLKQFPHKGSATDWSFGAANIPAVTHRIPLVGKILQNLKNKCTTFVIMRGLPGSGKSHLANE
jgi:hypothetical protein